MSKRCRNGLRTSSASPTTTMFMKATASNTICQPAADDFYDVGERNQERGGAFGGVEQAQIDGRVFGSERVGARRWEQAEISPQVRKIRAANSTNAQGCWPMLPGASRRRRRG